MIKLTFNTDLCKGCGLCVHACPKGVLAISKDKLNQKGYNPAEVVNADDCIGCAMCAVMCPDVAIKVER